MRGDAAGDVNADGGDLAFAHGRIIGLCPTALVQGSAAPQVPPPQVAPDAGESADAAGGDAKLAAEADQSLFHEADEVDRAEAVAAPAGSAGERRLRRSKMG